MPGKGARALYKYGTSRQQGNYRLASLRTVIDFCAGPEAVLVAQWSAVAAMISAVAPSFKSSSGAIERLMLSQIIFARTESVPLRLAASKILSLLPQISGPLPPQPQPFPGFPSTSAPAPTLPWVPLFSAEYAPLPSCSC